MVLYKRCPHRDTRSAAKRIRIAIVEGSKIRHSSAAQPNAACTHTQARDVSSSCPRRSCARARVQDQNAVRVTSRHALTMTCSVCEITTRNPDNCGFASRAAATLARQACLKTCWKRLRANSAASARFVLFAGQFQMSRSLCRHTVRNS